MTILSISIDCLAERYVQNSYTPIQFSVWDGVSNWPEAKYVYGLRLGTPYSHSADYIKETVNGIDFGIVSQSDDVNGVQFSFVNLLTERIKGLQMGFFSMGENLEGVQLNVYNFCADSTIYQLGGFNIGGHDVRGGFMGIANIVGDGSSGFQTGAVNYCDKYAGFQFGIINLSSESNSDSLQIGLINYCDNGFLTVFPFFNYSSYEGRENSSPEDLDFLLQSQVED